MNLLKMTVSEQIRKINSKKEQNITQNLDRQTAKISALSFGNLDKYKFLTGEDLSEKEKIY